MGKTQRRTRTHVKNKDAAKARRTRRRVKDIDQIQDEIRAAEKMSDKEKTAINPELPGMGQFFCVYCDKYYITDDVLQAHLRTKVHKKRVKSVQEKPYSQRDAEAAAGMAPPL